MDKDDIEVIGTLPTTVTVGSITCVPVIATLKDDCKTVQVSQNKREVEDHFWMPLYK